MRDARERLLDIRQAIERIEKYASRGRQAFDKDELLQNWVVHHLLVIGEAARMLPEDVKNRAPEIRWKEVIGTRHVLVHNYFDVDAEIVWTAVEKDLPVLKSAVDRILAQLGP